MTKTKQSKVWNKQAEHFAEHQFWNFTPAAPGRPGERGLPTAFDALVANFRSLCGGIDDSQPVEMYDGALGVPRDFVARHQGATAQLQWLTGLSNAFPDTGNVSGKRWATGVLIGRDLLLTAAHTFEEPAERWRLPRQAGSDRPIPPELAAVHMRANFNFQFNPIGQLRREVSYPVVELLEYRRRGLDFAIVRLGGFPGDRFGYAAISPHDAVERDMVCIIQHPEGQPKRLDAGPVFHLHGDQLGYDSIDTLGGSSGAGILQASTGLLVGLHTNGGCDQAAIGHNHGLRISAIIRESEVVRNLLNRGWRRANLSTVFGAPQLKGDPLVQWPVIVYRGHHGSIQQLRLIGETWTTLNLTALTNCPKLKGAPVLTAHGEQPAVYFRGRDHQLHELRYDSVWRYAGPVHAPGAPPAAADPAPTRSSLAYLGRDGQVYEFRRAEDQWINGGSPTQATGAPPARDGLHAIDEAAGYSLVYYSRNGALHHLRWTGQWRHQALRAPLVKGKPALWPAPDGESLEMAFRSRRGALIWLREAGGWQATNLTEAFDLPRAADDPVAFSFNERPHLLYRDRRNKLQLLSCEGDRWPCTGVNDAAGSPEVSGIPCIYIREGILHILYRTRNQELVEVWKPY